MGSERSETVQSHLSDISEQRGVDVLLARDMGSRARGLDNDESDTDVFFVFLNDASAMAVGRGSETIDESVDEGTGFEYHGWSLEKYVEGLGDSNPTAVEVAASDHAQYMIDDDAEGYFRDLHTEAVDYVKPYALIQHYRSMAASNYGKYIEGGYRFTDGHGWNDPLDSATFHDVNDDTPVRVDEKSSEIGTDEVRLVAETTNYFYDNFDVEYFSELGVIEPTTIDRSTKRYLNVCEALIRTRWLEETCNVPTMNFLDLLRDVADSSWLTEREYAQIGTLVAEKTSGEYTDGSIPVLDQWIESELDREIEPENRYVDTQPDSTHLRGIGEAMYDEVR